MYPAPHKFILTSCLNILFLTACSPQKTEQLSSNHTDILAGCYTVSPSEPAQIKINHEKTANGERYSMQMREFNDPNKDWDTPTPMQVLANNSPKVQQYFDIKSDEYQFVEKVITRDDEMFVLAKITDGFAQLNPQFDSPYLGFIYKGSNTIFKVSCDNNVQV